MKKNHNGRYLYLFLLISYTLKLQLSSGTGTMCLNECISQILENKSIFRRYRKSLMYMQLMPVAPPSRRQVYAIR